MNREPETILKDIILHELGLIITYFKLIVNQNIILVYMLIEQIKIYFDIY
ncbi:hypothetical protein IKU74_02125 [bacterium]|nr:hypothetical protein [bacterium]